MTPNRSKLDTGDKYREVISIRYEGLLADQNFIPVENLVESLQGWQQFYDLTTSIWINGRLTPKLLPKSQRPSLQLREIRPGSVEAVLEFVGSEALGGLIGGASVATATAMYKALAAFRLNAYRSYVQVKRNDKTIDKAVAGLRQLIRDKSTDRLIDDNPHEAVEKLDLSLRKATEPIDRAADRITLIEFNNGITINVDRKDRRAIMSDFSPVTTPDSIGDWDKYRIIVYRLNTKTGSCSFNFVNPSEQDQKGRQQTNITDGSMHMKRDPYSGSLHRREPIDVWCRKKILDSETDAYQWEISVNKPSNIFQG